MNQMSMPTSDTKVTLAKKTSPPQSHFGRAASPFLIAENGLAHCVC